MSGQIDMTIPAVRRPEALERMGRSFQKMVRHDGLGIAPMVNVDLVGGGSEAEILQAVEIIDVARKVRWGTPPSLNAAIRWLWRQPRSEIFLHVEDDVEFVRDVEMHQMIDAMADDPLLAYLAFPRRSFREGDIASDHNLEHTWDANRGFHWRSGKYRMSFGPGLVRRSFARRAADLITDEGDPEIQFHLGNERLIDWVSHWRFATWAQPGDTRAVIDTGKEARAAQGYRKVVGPNGTAWMKETAES